MYKLVAYRSPIWTRRGKLAQLMELPHGLRGVSDISLRLAWKPRAGNSGDGLRYQTRVDVSLIAAAVVCLKA